MVNIVGVVLMQPNGMIALFNNMAFVQHSLRQGASAERLAQLNRLDTLHDTCEQDLARIYNVPRATVKDVCQIFGNASETVRRLADDATRNLLFDLNNKIILQIRDNSPRVCRVSTVWTPTTFHTITSALVVVTRAQVTIIEE
jgi:hypothetical protein